MTGAVGKDSLGARAHVENDAFDDREGLMADRERDDVDENVGELLLLEFLVSAFGLEGVTEGL